MDSGSSSSISLPPQADDPNYKTFQSHCLNHFREPCLPAGSPISAKSESRSVVTVFERLEFLLLASTPPRPGDTTLPGGPSLADVLSDCCPAVHIPAVEAVGLTRPFLLGGPSHDRSRSLKVLSQYRQSYDEARRTYHLVVSERRSSALESLLADSRSLLLCPRVSPSTSSLLSSVSSLLLPPCRCPLPLLGGFQILLTRQLQTRSLLVWRVKKVVLSEALDLESPPSQCAVEALLAVVGVVVARAPPPSSSSSVAAARHLEEGHCDGDGDATVDLALPPALSDRHLRAMLSAMQSRKEGRDAFKTGNVELMVPAEERTNVGGGKDKDYAWHSWLREFIWSLTGY